MPRSTGIPACVNFPVVGIGVSTGGLESALSLLRHLPADAGMAFVFVPHPGPAQDSLPPELLSGATAMPVLEAESGTPVAPDHIYVTPPHTIASISHGVLEITASTEAGDRPMPIDAFLCSLAEDQKNQAVGVLLSGTSPDGVAGLEAIKLEGGFAFAQLADPADHGGTALDAAATAHVDFVLPPEAIGKKLTRLGQALCPGEEDLSRVILLLRNTCGVDFSEYRRDFLARRIAGRMAQNYLRTPERYLHLLQKHRAEIRALFQDILIKTTRFFRDPKTFEMLKNPVLLSLLRNRPVEAPVRIWAPGCATGEEVYSIAICLREALEETGSMLPVQIFGTDLTEEAIAVARTGICDEHIQAHLSPERLRRFFRKAEVGYQVTREVREVCVFARQNLAKDPPFSSLDLISCRNVLTYMQPVLQQRILSIFHHALRPGGVLLLGSSEDVDAGPDLFRALDRSHKFFSRQPIPGRPKVGFPIRQTPEPATREPDQLEALPERAVEKTVEAGAAEPLAQSEIAQIKEELFLTADYLDAIAEQQKAALATRAELESLKELLEDSGIAILVLGKDLSVRRFAGSDVGRSIRAIQVPDWTELIVRTIQEGCPQQAEVQDAEGRRYSIAARPHADGAVLTLIARPA